MSGSVFDAVVLLAADGLVAAGRVLGGLRRRCDTERRADAVDALNALEDSQDGLEPGQLTKPPMDSLLDAYWAAQTPEVETQALEDLRRYYPDSAVDGELHDLTISMAAENQRALQALHDTYVKWPEPEVRSAAVTTPAADNTRCAAAASIDGDPFLCCRDTGHAGPHNNPYQKASWIDAGADEVTAAELFAVEQAADNTTVDHLEAAYNYHRPQANYNGDLVWGCEGCNWSGRTIQAHSRHRFHVLADMKNATHRIQEQLGGAS